MMTLPFASALPPACHPFPQHPPDDDDTINPAFLLSAPYSMTKNDDAGYALAGQQPALAAGSWQLDVSFNDQSFSQAPFFALPASDATKSPGRNSHHQSSEDAASPTSQVVYTPSSSHEHDVLGNDSSERAPEDEDDSSRSPLSDSIFSSTTDSSFYMVPSAGYPDVGDPLPTGPQVTTLMDPRPQPASSGASAHPSRASSVANPSTPNHTTVAQWNASLSAREYLMGNNANDLPSGAFAGSDEFGFGSDAFNAQGQGLQYDWMPNIATPDSGATNNSRNVTQSSFRTFDNEAHFFGNFSYSAASYGQVAPAARELRERQHYFPHQYQQSQAMFPPQPMMQDPVVSGADYTQASMPRTSSLMVDQPAAMSSSAATMPPVGNMPIRSQRGVVVHAPQSATASRAAPYHAHPNQISTTHRNPHHRRSPNTALTSSSATAPSKRFNLAPRQDNRLVVPSNAPSAAAQVASHRKGKGGRARNMHLADDVRQQTSKMRGVRSCWRCALQRDKCDEGYPCRRCSIRSQKGQPDLLGCDRSKLPEWLDDLLPLSMTELHTKASIETFVAQQVSGWNLGNCIDIYLTSGYGPALMWRCCEFRPRGSELLGQLQYLQNTHAGRQEGKMKYAPPFALEKLDEADDERFQKYLNHQLMHPEALKTLPWTFYEEECMVDEQCFQAQMLDLMCTLFAETQDVQLREALQDIIRMLIVTYIMGHTLTIAEDTLPTVLARVRYTGEIEPHTSPRLANRQLKYYFSNLRNRTFNTVLHRQQQTFHDSKKKEAHWLVSFCAMLGFAMVLEETQRTIQIQADAKETKGEMTREQANAEALTHCRRIDEKFEKLICFFQKKYRDRKWDQGSFGNRTPSYRTLPESTFLGHLYGLLLASQHHLRARESVPLGPEHQCKYTSRLVAKFLLPFLNLAT